MQYSTRKNIIQYKTLKLAYTSSKLKGCKYNQITIFYQLKLLDRQLKKNENKDSFTWAKLQFTEFFIKGIKKKEKKRQFDLGQTASHRIFYKKAYPGPT